MRRFWVALVMILGGALMGVLGLTENTAAIASKDSILKLAELQGVYDCYVSNHVDTSVYQNSFNNATNKAGFITRGKSQSVLLPTGFTSDAGSKITCKVLFTDNKKGLPKLGYSMPNTAAGLGYTASGNKYVINNTKTAAATAVKNITGGGSIGAGKAQSVSGGTLYQWDNKAKYALYYYYLENLNAGKFVEQGSCGSTKPSGYTSYYRKSSSEWCGIKVNSDLRSIPLHIPTNAGYRMKTGTASDVLAFLANSDSYKGFSDSDYVGSAAKLSVAEGVTEEGEQEEAKSNSELCYGSQVVSQSWFLCPTIDNMEVAASAIDNMIGDWLQVDTNFYSSDSATYTVWEIMRNVANIAMVLVLLAVIVSQLTGWGIDNYGIKKILPRLVAMAIVVNLSFIACQLIIDASNILGSSLNLMFRSIGESITLPKGASVEKFLGEAITGIFAAAGVTGAAASTILTVVTASASMGPMAVILIAMALIAILAAVILFFAMLGARMVLVILCTAVAPVVAVLYVLPNTQRWAKNWWKLFQACLVMYPICGAVAGISYLVKTLVLSMEDVHLWMLVVGMIGPFLPFFMLPNLLKSAISMLGSVGAAMVAAGQGLRRGLTQSAAAIQNTDMAKDQMRRGAENLNLKMAGLKRRKGGGFDRTRRGERLLARAQKKEGGATARMLGMREARALKAEEEMYGSERLIRDGGMGLEAASIGQRKKADAEAVADYMTYINKETQNGENEKALYELFDQYVRGGSEFGVVAATRIAGRRKDTAARFAERLVGAGGIVNYDEKTAGSIAKEMATGENSGLFRQSAPVEFEFAARVNDGKAGTLDYSKWLGGTDENGVSNITNALDHNVTNTSELIGMKGSSLTELVNLMNSGMLDSTTEARIRNLATQGIENREKPGAPWDSTKAEQLASISGQYKYDKNTDTLTPIGATSSGQAQQQPSGVGQQADGGDSSAEGALFKIEHKGKSEQQQLQEAWERTQYGGQTRQEAEKAAEQNRLRQEWMNQQNNQNN